MKKLVILVLFSIALTGCSAMSKALLPYEENPICNAGKEGGYCGSLSDVYEHLEENEK